LFSVVVAHFFSRNDSPLSKSLLKHIMAPLLTLKAAPPIWKLNNSQNACLLSNGSSHAVLGKDIDGLNYFLAERLRRLDKVKKLWCVHVQKHTSDLTRLLANLLVLLDKREETLSEHHLLLLGWHGGELSGEILWARSSGRSGWRSGSWSWSWSWWSTSTLRVLRTTLATLLRSTTATATLGTWLLWATLALSVALVVLARLATGLWALHHVALRTTLLELLATLATLLWEATRATLGTAHLWLVVHLTPAGLHWVEYRRSLRWVHTWHATLWAALHAGLLDTLSHLGLELSTTLLLALGEGDVDWLGSENLAVHLSDGLGGLLWGGVANETEALAHALVVTHDLARGDGTVLLEGGTENVIWEGLVKVLDVEVHTLVLVDALLLDLIELVFELRAALRLLLGAANVHGLFLEGKAVLLLDSLGGDSHLSEVDEGETLGLAILGGHEGDGRDLTERLELLLELSLSDSFIEVLDKDVGELLLGGALLEVTISLALELTDVDNLLLKHLAFDLLDGSLSGLLGLVVNETVALGAALIVVGDLAGKDVTEGTEGIVQHLVINALVEVLDEDVTLARLANGRITMGPHNADWTTLDHGVVHGIQGTLSINHHVEVDVGVAKRATSDGVAADANAGDRANSVEDVAEESLCDLSVEITHIQRCGCVWCGSSGVHFFLGTL